MQRYTNLAIEFRKCKESKGQIRKLNAWYTNLPAIFARTTSETTARPDENDVEQIFPICVAEKHLVIS